MVVFFILLIVPVLLQHIKINRYKGKYQKKNEAAFTFFFLFLTVLLMLRHESVGNDTANYIYYFNRIMEINWNELSRYNLEIGYMFYNKVIALISSNPQVFLAITAILGNLMIYPTYKRLCIDSSLTIVIYCILSTFVMMFSGIRQMIAISIGFISYEFVRKKQIIPFIILVCLAMSFHSSAFMLFFMYPLYHAKITKKWLFIVVPVMGIVFIFNKQIFSVLSVLLSEYTRFDSTLSSTGAYSMIVLFSLFGIFSFVIPDESKLNEEIVGLRNFLLFSIVIQFFAPLHTLAMRMNYYYIIFIPLLIPLIIKVRKVKMNNVATFARHLMVIFFILYFFVAIAGSGTLHVFPYHFFWEAI